MGGALLLNTLSWGATMLAYNARPPDPQVVGDRWRAMWLERMAGAPPFAAAWLTHQLRDAYWRHGSVCEDYGAITAATYAVGGWADAYSNAVPRLVANLSAPVKGLIGPWAHEYPQAARPGPQIGFLQECLRWWDRWLKGRATGIDREPRLRAWIQDSVPPAADHDTRPGHWVAERRWPPRRKMRRHYLAEGRLLDRRRSGAVMLTHCSPLATGVGWGEWCPYGYPGELPIDQRADDGRSLCFDSAPLAAALDLLGAPVLRLRLAIDRPVGLIAARLCNVAPDGASTLMSYGILNLTHRDGHDRALPMVPGEPVSLSLQLNDMGERVAAGHSIRLALSTSYWPMVWPAPEPVTMTLFAHESELALPVRPPQPQDAGLSAFPPAETAPGARITWLHPDRRDRTVQEEATTGRTTVTFRRENGAYRVEDIDLLVEAGAEERFAISEGDPLSARAEILWRCRLQRGDWDIRTESRTVLTASKDLFHLQAALDAFEGDSRVFARNWSFDIPREGV